MIFEGFCKLVAVNPLRRQADGKHHRIIQVETLKSSEIAGVFHHDFIAGIQHDGGKHIQCLLGAVGNDDLTGVKINILLLLVAFADVLAKREIALCGVILQGTHTVLLQDLAGSRLHLLNGEGRGVRKSACEGDNAGICRRLQNIGEKICLKVRLLHSLRDFNLHSFSPLL